MKPLVTVISPVHNGGKYLAECIESVIAQTYDNWEYLIAENCSSDNTYAIAQSYAERDSRIRVVKFDELLPVVANHNRAFALIPEHAAYFKPLMADDWLFPDCLERMVSAAEAHPSIGVVACYAFDGRYAIRFGFPFPAHFVPGREALRVAMLSIGEGVILGTPTAMLYRADLARKRRPFYDSDNFHADHETCLDILAESDFSFLHQILCLNREHAESQTSKHMYRLESLPAHEASLVHKYGPLCLNKEELADRRRRVMGHYYERLAVQWFNSRDQEFWNYHRKNFQRMNMSLESADFNRAIRKEFIRMIRGAPRRLARASFRWTGLRSRVNPSRMLPKSPN